VVRVRVSFTVDIDPESWQGEYGMKFSDVRNDVKYYAEQIVFEQFAQNGVLVSG
jgi:hypothetical protein